MMYDDFFGLQDRQLKNGSWTKSLFYNLSVFVDFWDNRQNASITYNYIILCIAERRQCYNQTKRWYDVFRAMFLNVLYPEQVVVRNLEVAVFSPIMVLGVVGKPLYFLSNL